MAKPRVNIQDQFLNQARKERIAVRIELLTGSVYEGSINSFDNFCIVLKAENAVQLFYKHAIAFVEPLEGSDKIELF